MIDTNDSEFLSRIEDKGLLSKVCDAKTAAKCSILAISSVFPDLPPAAIRRLQCMNSQNA